MLRGFLESITGIFTGSDMPLDLTFPLQQMGALGEEHSGDDGSCWITKTHFPMESFEIKFHASKMIVIVRNPIDVVPSMM
jgi:hypothetical protein